MKADVLLFNPPAPDGKGYTREGRCTQEAGVWGTQWPPLTLATAAALLKAAGRRVVLRDYPARGLGAAALATDLRALQPAFAIWSTGTPTLPFDLGLARLVRAAAPGAVTAVLGTHVAARPAEALAEGALDAVIRGEPEGVIGALVQNGADAGGPEENGAVPDFPGGAAADGTPGGPWPEGAGGGFAGREATAADGPGTWGSAPDLPGTVSGAGACGAGGPPRRSRSGWAGIGGLSWRDGAGGIRHNPDAEPLAPAAIPAPDWGDLDLDDYRLPLKGRRFLIVAPVRGCPWHCSFCTAPLYYGSRLRRRPVAAVVAEMADASARYGIGEFFVWADTFTADKHYVREFCAALLTAGLKVSWTCNSRVDTIDGETLALMKRAGLWMISYGIESANAAVLAACGKGITAEQSRAAVEAAHRLGIKTAGHFIFGLPGETAATMAETLAFALSLPLDVAQFYAAAPFPGTALHAEAVAKGWLKGDGGHVRKLGSDPNSSGFSQGGAALCLPGLPAAEVDAFRRRAFRRFYLRPAAVARLLALAEPGALAGFTAPLRRFLGWAR